MIFKLLLLLVPLSLVLEYVVHAGPLWIFATAVLAIVPLAEWIRKSTEHLAERLGSAIGGLLNVTFGNMAELILALFVLYEGHANVVKGQITGAIIAAAMRVHTALGPGLLESVYCTCLKHELTKQGLKVESEVWLPVQYDTLKIEGAYRADLIVEDVVVVELKAVEAVLQLHKAQLLSYLILSGKPVGLLLNFNVVHLRDGITRLINKRRKAAGAAN